MADDEVYYCAHCRRQQSRSQGERCIQCRSLTVSWRIDREDEEQAKRRWKAINGKP